MKHLYALLLLSLSLNAQVATDTIVTDTTAIDNVEIAAAKHSHDITIGNASRKDAILQPCSNDWDMLGKLFIYKEAYAATPYLQNVEVYTRNRSKAVASFKIHLYTMGPDSLPAEELVPDGILVQAKRGNRKCRADLSTYKITMPKGGLIVSYEWLKDSSNLYPYEGTGSYENGEVIMAKKRDRAMVYAPDIYRNDVPEAIGYWRLGMWHKFGMNEWAMHDGMWFVPAINITLSN
ncbi:MAG: hypothetical protein V4581_15495 [Bacteroidota bacterium]